MPRVKQSQLARARGHNEMSQSVAARMTRNKMRADWDTVRAMLTDPKSPRRDAQGRDVFEVWADMILANPATKYTSASRSPRFAGAHDGCPAQSHGARPAGLRAARGCAEG
jgi:hypothetical protein